MTLIGPIVKSALLPFTVSATIGGFSRNLSSSRMRLLISFISSMTSQYCSSTFFSNGTTSLYFTSQAFNAYHFPYFWHSAIILSWWGGRGSLHVWIFGDRKRLPHINTTAPILKMHMLLLILQALIALISPHRA